jgi:hypothetical protein
LSSWTARSSGPMMSPSHQIRRTEPYTQALKLCLAL